MGAGHESRSLTGLTHEAFPVWVDSFERSWSASFDDLNFCALSALPKKNKSMNAVLFEVSDINLFDERETGYVRQRLSPNQIRPYFTDQNLPILKSCWIYKPKDEIISTPSEKYIIWQSYLDVCLSGCLEISNEFAVQFIETTTNWRPQFWADDRKNNQYLKALKKYNPVQINRLLAEKSLAPNLHQFDDSALRRHIQKRLI